MRITTIGRGSIGGTLARLWSAAGHQVTALGRDGGDASDADVVLLAVRHADIPAALAGGTGLRARPSSRPGIQPRPGGPLDRAATQEAFAALFVAIVKDA